MGWEIVKVVSVKNHHCRRPGALARWRYHLGVGSIIECSCGKFWQYVPDWCEAEADGWAHILMNRTDAP